MAILCPLSGSSNVILLEKIRTVDLSKAYRRQLKADISSEFGSIKEIGFYFCPESDLKFFYPLIVGSELFYEKMQKLDWYYLDEKNEYEYAKKLVKKTDAVLEIGCGKGVFKEKINTANYTGLEFSNNAIIIAGQRGINVLKESVKQHSLRNADKYDVVCSFQVLEHVSDIHSFIESCITCLKPGGLLIYSVPNADSFLSFVENTVMNMPPHHVSWWTDKALKKIADIFNIKTIKIEHEQLADIHLRLYATEIVRRGIKRKVGLKHYLIDSSFTGYIIGIASNLIGIFYARWLKNSVTRPIGHSITVVYQKPGLDI